ncbi:MAG: hypothetical protein JNK75_11680 [Betaproteobacteria bacterium]|nr:hypothetical protein [Betaproteobacteria bacterium]
MSTVTRSCLQPLAAVTCTVGALATANPLGTGQPWSEVSAGFVPSQTTDGHYVAIIVSSIEGESTDSLRTAVPPGKKRMLVDTPRQPDDLAPSHKRIAVDLAPCLRYFVAGKRTSGVSRRWEPVVIRVEEIEECVATFPKYKQTATPAAASNP